MTTAKAVIQELRQLADSRYYAARSSILLTAAETLERISAQLAEWQTTFPDRTAAEIALTFATADWCIRANGRLMAENERLRALVANDRPLTWAEKAWQEYKASPPKDEITCMKCGFKVSRPVEGKRISNCQTCGAQYALASFY